MRCTPWIWSAPAHGATASRVALAPGTGYFAQTVGRRAASPAAGSLFWISDTGVRYGIDNEAGRRLPDTGKPLRPLA